MALFKSCCGLSLRSGTIIIGFLNILVSAYNMIGTSVQISVFQGDTIRYIQLGLENEEDPNVKVLGSHLLSFIDLVIGLSVFASIVYLFIAWLLTFGAWKGKKMFLLPWMAFQLVGLFFAFLVLISLFWAASRFGPIATGVLIVWLFIFLLGIFFLLIVYSHFQELCDKDDKFFRTPQYSTSGIHDPGFSNALSDDVYDIPDNKPLPV